MVTPHMLASRATRLSLDHWSRGGEGSKARKRHRNTAPEQNRNSTRTQHPTRILGSLGQEAHGEAKGRPRFSGAAALGQEDGGGGDPQQPPHAAIRPGAAPPALAARRWWGFRSVPMTRPAGIGRWRMPLLPGTAFVLDPGHTRSHVVTHGHTRHTGDAGAGPRPPCSSCCRAGWRSAPGSSPCSRATSGPPAGCQAVPP